MRDHVRGIDELRALVDMAGWSHEDAFDEFGLVEAVRLLRACQVLDLEVLPDQLTTEERRFAAKHGRVSMDCLRRLYRAEGLPETGKDWEGHS